MDSLCTSRTHITLRPCVALHTLNALHTLLALHALRTLRTLGTSGTDSADRARQVDDPRGECAAAAVACDVDNEHAGYVVIADDFAVHVVSDVVSDRHRLRDGVVKRCLNGQRFILVVDGEASRACRLIAVTVRARRAGVTLRTLHTLDTLHALRAGCAGCTGVALCALLALRTLGTGRAGLALNTLRTLRTNGALRTLRTRVTLRTLRTRHAGKLRCRARHG